MYRLLAMLILCFTGVASAQESRVEHGRTIAVRLCAQCHGLGNTERSPHATAPAFRRLEPRVDLNELGERLREGILAGHPEMPAFKLTREEASAVVAYIRSIQAGN